MENFMEKDYINGTIINILKELIIMVLKKAKGKLDIMMEKNVLLILKMENRMEKEF